MRSAWKPLLVVILGAVLGSSTARAEQPPSGYPPPCDSAATSKANVDRAHTVFLSGKQFLDESNYEKAIGYFKDAYSIDCSVHGILPIIATAYERKGDKSEAVAALQEYLWRAPAAADHDVIARRIKNLSDQLSREQHPAAEPAVAPAVTTSPPAISSGTTAAPAPAPAASVASSALESAPAGNHGIGPWIVVGAGGAAILGGAVSYLVGAGDVASAETLCPSRPNCNNPTAATQGNSGRHLETGGVIIGGVGIAAVVGGLIWHFAEKTGGAGSQASARLKPTLAPGYAGVAFGGPI